MPDLIPKELKTAATTASQSLNKVVSNASAVTQGVLNGPVNSLDLKSAALSGLTNFGKNLLGNLPGIDVVTGAASIAAGEPNLGKLITTNGFKLPVAEKPPFPNVLNNFSSFNYHFTLSVLSDVHINDPDNTYRKGNLGTIILASAGSAPDKNLITTAYGQYDFFIENLRLSTVVGLNKATGNSNAISFSFQIIEPYSMGLFFQSLQTAAIQNRYNNYLDVPLLLTIKFKGHVGPENLNITLDGTTKMLPLKLREVNMRVTAKGCTYDVEAYPWNEQGFSDIFNVVKTDINIQPDEKKPKTIQSVLQTSEKSLQAVVNANLKKQTQDGTTDFYDEILILFPPDPKSGSGASSQAPNESDRGATQAGDSQSSDIFTSLGVARGTNSTLIQGEGESAVNAIGRAGLGLNVFNKGDTPFAKDNFAYDEASGTYKRGKMTINPNIADFKFAQGSTIQDIINQVILMSDYGRQALDQAKRTPQGQIVWWRIETQMYLKPLPEDSRKGQKPKLIVFRVLPYLVNASVFMPPNDKAPGLDNQKKESLKEYNYIYTGKNIDVLDFQINFNTGFYKVLNADSGKSSETHQGVSAQTGGAAEEQGPNKQKNPAGSAPPTVGTPVTNQYVGTGTSTAKNGGTGVDDAATIAARQFHDLATTGADMINLNLTILGDPYYIVDSGVGNYTAGATEFQNLNSDGAMDYQTGEVYITVNFRTPIDINTKTGFYNFGDSRPVQQFSGLYKVMQVESTFNRAKFTQTLSLVRMVGQDNENAKEGKNPIPDQPQPQSQSGGFENSEDATENAYEGTDEYATGENGEGLV